MREPNQGLRRHKLMTDELRSKFPDLGKTDGQGYHALVVAKYFGGSRYTFFATEFDGDDTLYGYTLSALGAELDEWGSTSLTELQHAVWDDGYLQGCPMVERDLYWTPVTVEEALNGQP